MANVKLILREDVEKLGHAGDLVSVKPGFARNFLLRQGKASLATTARYLRIATTKVCSTASPLDWLPRPLPPAAPSTPAQPF